MKRIALQDLTVDALVQEFATLAVRQDTALLQNDIAEVNRIFWKLEAVEAELKAREGDQRRALLSLYQNPVAQVRLKAAKATLAVEREAALRTLETIVESGECPQAGEAGMTLINLSRGIFKPT